MHDTIEVFSENLDELQKLFRGAVALKLHRRRVAELEGAADRLFGKVEDTIREAALKFLKHLRFQPLRHLLQPRLRVLSCQDHTFNTYIDGHFSRGKACPPSQFPRFGTGVGFSLCG